MDAEVAALDAQRLAHREERVEHQLLRNDAEDATRRRVVGRDVVAEQAQVLKVMVAKINREYEVTEVGDQEDYDGMLRMLEEA